MSSHPPISSQSFGNECGNGSGISLVDEHAFPPSPPHPPSLQYKKRDHTMWTYTVLGCTIPDFPSAVHSFDELYNRCLYLIVSSQWQFNLQHLSEISGYFWNNRHDFSSPSHHDSLYPFSLTHISFLVIVFSLLLILFSLFGSLCSLSQSSLLLFWTHDSLFYFCFSTVSPFVLAILALCLGLC